MIRHRLTCTQNIELNTAIVASIEICLAIRLRDKNVESMSSCCYTYLRKHNRIHPKRRQRTLPIIVLRYSAIYKIFQRGGGENIRTKIFNNLRRWNYGGSMKRRNRINSGNTSIIVNDEKHLLRIISLRI